MLVASIVRAVITYFPREHISCTRTDESADGFLFSSSSRTKAARSNWRSQLLTLATNLVGPNQELKETLTGTSLSPLLGTGNGNVATQVYHTCNSYILSKDTRAHSTHTEIEKARPGDTRRCSVCAESIGVIDADMVTCSHTSTTPPRYD